MPSGTLLSQWFLIGETLTKPEQDQLSHDVSIWRQRLTDVSRFMRIVNEAIARPANAEDKCTGQYWEGRFKSQTLLDDKALLARMAYVDLNPIRVGIAKIPESSQHTCLRRQIESQSGTDDADPTIEDFVSGAADIIGLPFKLLRTTSS